MAAFPLVSMIRRRQLLLSSRAASRAGCVCSCLPLSAPPSPTASRPSTFSQRARVYVYLFAYGATITGIIWLYFKLPKTKDHTLEGIDDMFLNANCTGPIYISRRWLPLIQCRYCFVLYALCSCSSISVQHLCTRKFRLYVCTGHGDKRMMAEVEKESYSKMRQGPDRGMATPQVPLHGGAARLVLGRTWKLGF